MADVNEVSIDAHRHQSLLRGVAEFDSPLCPKIRHKEMIRNVPVLVNKGGGGIVFGGLKTAFTKNLSNSFSTGLISRMDALPVDGIIAVVLVRFHKRLQLLRAKRLPFGIVETMFESRTRSRLRCGRAASKQENGQKKCFHHFSSLMVGVGGRKASRYPETGGTRNVFFLRCA